MIHLNKATNEDIMFISKVCRSSNEIYSQIMPNAFIKQANKYEVSGLPPDYKIYIINNDKEQIGFLGISSLNERSIYLVAIYLHKNFYRLGYGGETINLLCKELKNHDIKEIVLQAHKDATWAINFYKKFRFEEICNPTKDLNFKLIDNTLIMRKKL